MHVVLMAGRERLKVLPTVSVRALQDPLQKGFEALGHRNMLLLVPMLEGMNWKTSACKHACAYVHLEHLLKPLLSVCSNGLVPDAMLLNAFHALNAEQPFQWNKEVSPQATAVFFFMKIRQMAAKVRDLVTCRSAWETLAKKLTTPQHETFARLGRCICPTFLVSDAQDTKSHAESQKATNSRFCFRFFVPWSISNSVFIAYPSLQVPESMTTSTAMVPMQTASVASMSADGPDFLFATCPFL